MSITKPLLTIITVTYNSFSSTATELTKLIQVSIENPLVELIVIDNSESSSDYEDIKQIATHPSFMLLKQPNNPGFAFSCNLGAKMASSPWVMMFNPDALMDKVSLQKILKTLQDAKMNQTFATTLLTNSVPLSGIGFSQGVWFKDLDASNDPQRPIGPSGGAGIYPTSLFNEFGGFREDLFAWGEDADLALRLKNKGILCNRIDVSFSHIGGHSHMNSKSIGARKAFLLSRNRQIVAWANYPGFDLLKFQVIALANVFISGIRKEGQFNSRLRGNLKGFKIGFKNRRRKVENES